MECNKDEAIRAMEIADKKFKEMDYEEADRFIIKAKQLYSQLSGLPQLAEVISIHLISCNKINGEFDWYGILGVHPLATDDVLRKQYKKKLLAVHPDRNNYAGATSAFMIVRDAWNVLSCREKRCFYNDKTKIKTAVRPTETRRTSGSDPVKKPSVRVGVKHGEDDTAANRGSSSKRKRKRSDPLIKKARNDVMAQLNALNKGPRT